MYQSLGHYSLTFFFRLTLLLRRYINSKNAGYSITYSAVETQEYVTEKLKWLQKKPCDVGKLKGDFQDWQ